MLDTYRMIRGDRQRLPSWDDTEYIQLDTLDSTDIDDNDVPDLTDRTVELSLVTKARGGDRIDLSNSVEIGDPTAGEVAIILEEQDTAVPIDGVKTNLYGEFRISGGAEDPTTAGIIKIELYPSRHDVEGEAALLPYAEDFGDFQVDGILDAEGARVTTLADPEAEQDAVNQRTLTTGLSSKADSDGGGTATLNNYAAVGTESINNVAFADAAQGVPAVQSVLDSVDTPATVYVLSSSLNVTWSDTLQIPNNVRCEAWGDYRITLSDEADLTPRTVNGDDWYALISNGTLDGTAEGVEIVGFDVDFSGVENEANKAAIHLHDATQSKIIDCEARNVPGTAPGRQYDILVSDSSEWLVEDCVADTAGYESIGIRGDVHAGTVRGCKASNGGSHSIQVAHFVGDGGAYSGHAHDILIEDCKVDHRVNIDSQMPENPIQGVTVRQCRNTSDTGQQVVRFNGHIRNCRAEDNSGGQVRLAGQSSTFDGVTIDGHETIADVPAVSLFGESGNVYDNITVRNIHRYDGGDVILGINNNTGDPTAVEFRGNIKVIDCSNTSGGQRGIVRAFDNAEVECVELVRCHANTDEMYRQEGDNGVTETVIFTNCDLSEVGEATTELFGGTVNTTVIDGEIHHYFNNEMVEFAIPDVPWMEVNISIILPDGTADIFAQFSTDGGATWLEATNYSYSFGQVLSSDVDKSENAEDVSEIKLGMFGGGANNRASPVKLTVSEPTYRHPYITWNGDTGDSYNASRIVGSATYKDQVSINHIRLFQLVEGTPSPLVEFECRISLSVSDLR